MDVLVINDDLMEKEVRRQQSRNSKNLRKGTCLKDKKVVQLPIQECGDMERTKQTLLKRTMST